MSRLVNLAIFVALMIALNGRAADRDAGPAQTKKPLVPVALETGPAQAFVDLDQIAQPEEFITSNSSPEPWEWQALPTGLIYENYLAGTKESRMSINFLNEDELGWLMDGTVGGRVGIFRYGTSTNPIRPEGLQLDVEGSAQLRLDPEEHRDLRSVDFRCGLPLTYGHGRVRWKFGYYHTSAHLGDEFLLQNPGFTRLNFSRDVLILGRAVYITPRTRIYAEAGWAFYSDVSEPWEFQFGIDHAPDAPTGILGAPFWAVNGHLRQEVDFGGSVTAQAGWAWRSDSGSPLMRAGVHYFNGKSNQYSFYNDHEQQLGMALWYDY